MTSHAGNFTPTQGQPAGWTAPGWNQSAGWGWNPHTWNPTSTGRAAWWNQNAGWNPQSPWNSTNAPQNPNPPFAPCAAPMHGMGCGSFAAEVAENSNEYILTIDVPGIHAEDLDVSLTGNTVVISGLRKDAQDPATLAYSEVAKGSITRALAVPFDIGPNRAINTSLDNGVLKIRIAKENNQSDKKTATRKVKIG